VRAGRTAQARGAYAVLQVDERRTPAHGTDFRSDLEGLRAVAVLLVISDHLLGRPFGGFIGVDVFFVLSGFLISGILLKEGERTGRVSIREFYARRIRRIMPAALLVLVTTTLAGWFVFTAGRAQETLQDAVWAGGFLANVHFADVGTDYFQEGLPPSALQHYWSLSVEEQFYVVWPVTLLLLFLAASRLRRLPVRRVIGVVAALTTLASFAWCVRLTDTAPTDAYFSTPARAWELSLGALLAVCAAGLMRVAEPVRAAASWLGLAGIAAAALVITPETAFPGYAAALPVGATALFLAAGNPRGGPGRTFLLGSAVPQYVGRLSYSLYLWHWPCIVLAAAYWGAEGFAYYVTAAALPALLAVLSFHVVEDPVRRSRWLSAKPEGYRRPTSADWYRANKRGLDVALVGSAATAFLIVGWLDVQQDPDAEPPTTLAVAEAQESTAAAALSPAEQRVATALELESWDGLDDVLDDLPSQVAPEWKPDGCINVVDENLDQCVYGDRAGARTAVVIGDSVAVSWMQGIRGALDDGWRIQMLTFGECPAPTVATARNTRTRGTEFKACTEHRAWTVEQVKRIKPDLLIASSQPTFAGRIVGIESYDSAANYAAWQRGMTETLRALKPHSGRMVVLAAPPKSGNLQECVTRRGSPRDCVLPLSRHWTGVSGAERAASRETGATYVDTQAWHCHERRCPAVVDGASVMWDGAHITWMWSRRLAPSLRGVLSS
jgi:peptidoglycan/LPS O-acetylase OafA/YrhL